MLCLSPLKTKERPRDRNDRRALQRHRRSSAAGGMGEVWRAEDTKLGRDVALKVLPASFAQDPERLARFEREAQVLASLSHPNIAGIHGLEEVDGQRFLVMELAEGETLAGAPRAGTARRGGRRAHRAADRRGARGRAREGHRPPRPQAGQRQGGRRGPRQGARLRPGQGAGDAPALGRSRASRPPTPPPWPMTQAGVLLGTAGYMSPEQARGKPVDRRADIWSFGCVLYEMLAGRRAFDGETVTDVLGAIVHKEPDLARAARRTCPAPLRTLLAAVPAEGRLTAAAVDRRRARRAAGVAREPDGGRRLRRRQPRAAGRRWLPWAAALGAAGAGRARRGDPARPRAPRPSPCAVSRST